MAGAGKFLSRGVLVGVVAALVWSRYASRSEAELTSDATSGATSAPPIWTPAGMQARARDLANEIARKQAPRVPISEAELMGQKLAASASAPTSASAPPQRAPVYQADGATLVRMFADHERERSALPWARRQEGALRQLFTAHPGEQPDDVDIDCRTKTCSAHLTFDSAAQRDDYLRRDQLPLADGCHAVTAVPRQLAQPSPEPPYHLRVLYLCR